MIHKVIITKKARKELKTIPGYIALKLYDWADQVAESGLANIRKIKGYHDEPLKGQWKGFRSIRLSKAYRAIYIIKSESKIEFVSIEEVSKHGY